MHTAIEEDSYTKEETKSTKFVNLVHAASLNQASAVASGQPHATTLAEFNAAFPGFDGNQQMTEPLSSLDEETPEGGPWPTLTKAWSAKSPAAATAQVCLSLRILYTTGLSWQHALGPRRPHSLVCEAMSTHPVLDHLEAVHLAVRVATDSHHIEQELVEMIYLILALICEDGYSNNKCMIYVHGQTL